MVVWYVKYSLWIFQKLYIYIIIYIRNSLELTNNWAWFLREVCLAGQVSPGSQDGKDEMFSRTFQIFPGVQRTSNASIVGGYDYLIPYFVALNHVKSTVFLLIKNHVPMKKRAIPLFITTKQWNGCSKPIVFVFFPIFPHMFGQNPVPQIQSLRHFADDSPSLDN